MQFAMGHKTNSLCARTVLGKADQRTQIIWYEWDLEKKSAIAPLLISQSRFCYQEGFCLNWIYYTQWPSGRTSSSAAAELQAVQTWCEHHFLLKNGWRKPHFSILAVQLPGPLISCIVWLDKVLSLVVFKNKKTLQNAFTTWNLFLTSTFPWQDTLEKHLLKLWLGSQFTFICPDMSNNIQQSSNGIPADVTASQLEPYSRVPLQLHLMLSKMFSIFANITGVALDKSRL